jgi:hypothetical protein
MLRSLTYLQEGAGNVLQCLSRIVATDHSLKGFRCISKYIMRLVSNNKIKIHKGKSLVLLYSN